MNTKIFSLPYSDYAHLTSAKYLTLICDENFILYTAELTDLMVVHLYDDEYYDNTLESGNSLDESEALETFYYDIKYIRMTRLCDVVKGEWDLSLWDTSMAQYLKAEDAKADGEAATPNTIVKVFGVQPINYDLKSLRKSFGKASYKKPN